MIIALAMARDKPALAQSADRQTLNDPVAQLERQLERGDVSLDFRPGSGYLLSLLDRLGVNVDSQLLVFSKTSFQQRLISPRAPRAVFFNDTVAVGSVQGGDVLELMSLDPAQGFIFYTLNARQSDLPRFERRGVECAFCHLPGNHGAPGLVVASVIPDAQGTPFFTGSFFGTTDQRTPFDRRWGGWYVTGTHGSQTHMGNAVAPDPDHPVDLDQSANGNVITLAGKFDAASYLTTTSDIVALMTLEHQAGVTNRILGLSRLTNAPSAAGGPTVRSGPLTARSTISSATCSSWTRRLFERRSPACRRSRQRSRPAVHVTVADDRSATSTCGRGCFATTCPTWCTARRSTACRHDCWSASFDAFTMC